MKSLIETAIVDIINNFRKEFLSKKNVIGIGLGKKIINGLTTKEPCLHIFVEKKLPKNNLYKEDILPNNFLGVKTDVIQSGKFKANNLNKKLSSNTNSPKFKSYNRPIQAGYSIGPLNKNYAGTLGAIVFDNEINTPYILSSNHILAGLNKLKINHQITQPGILGSNMHSKYIIARLSRVLLLQFAPNTPIAKFSPNIADCALAKINANVSYTKIFPIINSAVTRTNLPLEGKKVKKIGRSTGYTEGVILSTDVTIITEIADGLECLFIDQILSTNISDFGDSGALVLSSFNSAIGLINSNSSEGTIISPIDPILNYFNVHL